MTSTEMLEYEFQQLQVEAENWRILRREEENLRGRIAAVEIQVKALRKYLQKRGGSE